MRALLVVFLLLIGGALVVTSQEPTIRVSIPLPAGFQREVHPTHLHFMVLAVEGANLKPFDYRRLLK
jgi:hypothetical protein